MLTRIKDQCWTVLPVRFWKVDLRKIRSFCRFVVVVVTQGGHVWVGVSMTTVEGVAEARLLSDNCKYIRDTVTKEREVFKVFWKSLKNFVKIFFFETNIFFSRTSNLRLWRHTHTLFFFKWRHTCARFFGKHFRRVCREGWWMGVVRDWGDGGWGNIPPYYSLAVQFKRLSFCHCLCYRLLFVDHWIHFDDHKVMCLRWLAKTMQMRRRKDGRRCRVASPQSLISVSWKRKRDFYEKLIKCPFLFRAVILYIKSLWPTI